MTSGSGLFNLFIDTAGTFAEVNAGMEPGLAVSSIRDPAVYDNASGQTFALSFGLTAGFGVQAFIEGGGGTAFSSISTSAGSNIPGLETFFSWSVAVDGQDPSNLVFSFTSNPLLGLDDIAITNNFLSHLTFNPADGSYILTSDFDYLSFSVTVPAGQERVEFSWDTDAIAEASGVPEPATIFLLGTGLAGVACKVLSRKHVAK